VSGETQKTLIELLKGTPRPDGTRPRFSRVQAHFLLLLTRRHPRSLGRVAEEISVNRTAAHHASLLLRERGWVERDADAWRLTPAGEEVLPAVRAWLRARNLPDQPHRPTDSATPPM